MEVWDVLLDAMLDTLKILPILVIVYYLIGFLEYKKCFDFSKSKFLQGKASPIFGALFGCVPQCGFSVVSTDLFTRRNMSIGALLAVYIATSDEAIPIMLSEPSSIPYLLLLIAIKVVFGILVGYLTIWLYGKIFKKNKVLMPATEACNCGACNCSGATKDGKFDWFHPLTHVVKIALFVLVINLIMGFVVMGVGGEEALATLFNGGYYVQPLVAVLIGLIPNCSASIVLTELYLMGGISFGSIVAGLSVNAGLGILMLLKQNKNIKENLFIIAMLIIPSLCLGYGLHFIM